MFRLTGNILCADAVYDASKKVLFGREEHCHTQHQDSDCEES